MEKSYEKNFYAIDTETTGLQDPHPVQIGIQLYKDGKLSNTFSSFFLPDK